MTIDENKLHNALLTAADSIDMTVPPTPVPPPVPTPPPVPVPPPVPPTPQPVPTPPPIGKGVFPNSHYLHDPIPANPRLDPNSDAWAALMAPNYPGAHVVIYQLYGNPTWIAGPNDPKTRLKVTMEPAWGDCAISHYDIPMPAGVQSNPGGDGTMVIIDPVQGLSFSLGSFVAPGPTSPTGETVWGGAYKLDGDGAHGESPGGSQSRGNGAETDKDFGAMMLPERRALKVNHALQFSTSQASGEFREPASGSDSGSGGWPQGTRFYFPDPHPADYDTWTPEEKMIYDALHIYGMYCIDTGGAIVALGRECPHPGDPDPWDDSYYTGLEMFPWKDIKALASWNGV